MVAEYQKTLTGFLICVESVSSLQFQVPFRLRIFFVDSGGTFFSFVILIEDILTSEHQAPKQELRGVLCFFFTGVGGGNLQTFLRLSTPFCPALLHMLCLG